MPRHPWSRFAAATLHEAVGKPGDLCPSLWPIGPARLFGPVFTVRCLDSESRAAPGVAATAPAGSVIVIAAGGIGRATVWGAASTRAAAARGAQRAHPGWLDVPSPSVAR